MNVLDAAVIRNWQFPILLRRSHFKPGQALVITSVSRTEPLVVIGGYIRNWTLAEEPRQQGLLENDYKFFHEARTPDEGLAKDLSFCAEIMSRTTLQLMGRDPLEAERIADVE